MIRQCTKLAVARLPETTKTSFGNQFLEKIKGRLPEVVWDLSSGQPELFLIGALGHYL